MGAPPCLCLTWTPATWTCPALLRTYAGFKTDFLEQGSVLGSAEVPAPANLCPMTRAGLDSLLGQVPAHRLLQGKNARLRPCASIPRGYRRQWELIEAGQRQIMKGTRKKGGILQFGARVVSAADGSIAALLGASQ